MNSILVRSTCGIVATILFLSLISCDQNSIATQKATADKKAVGHWRLVSITSGWTGKTKPPTEKINMSINEYQQATIYKSGTEVSHYQYELEEEIASQMLRYIITQQSGTSPIYFPPKGYFRVSSKQLVMNSTPVDGPAYTFERD